MRFIPAVVGFTLLAALIGGAWVLRYRPQWLQSSGAAAADDDEVDPQKLEIPVQVVSVTRATLHQYVDAIGVVQPAPARAGQMAGTADVAAPVPGVVAQVLCEAGQQVKKGDPLIQLDDRLALSAEKQAEAALAEAKASQSRLQSTPRPEQLQAARLAVEKASAEVDFAQKNNDRQQALAKNQGASTRTAEQAAMDLSSARNDLAAAQTQLVLLKPAPEELAEEDAKVAAAQAALQAAQTQREMLKIVSPIDATVIAVSTNPGEAVDSTKVLVDLVGLDRLVVDADVPVDESTSIKDQMPAKMFLGAAGDDAQPLDGTIHFVGSEVDRKTNTIPVSIDIAPGSGARPGQSVRVRIVVAEHKDCLVVPKECVVADENGDPFIAVVSGDQAIHKTVRPGLREDNMVEIQADDLKPGDQVVSSGAYALSKFQAAKIKVTEK